MPPTGVTQLLRLTPRDHDGQHVVAWRIDLSEDCLLHQHEDAFGNIIHSFTAEGPFNKLMVEVAGDVDTQDTDGLVNGAVERSPPQFYLRDTLLTQTDAAIIDFARATRADTQGDTLVLLHALLTTLNREIAFDTDPTHAATTAAEAFSLRRGVCQDLTHIFVAAARSLDIPARYVGGHFHRADGVIAQEAGHISVGGGLCREPGLGWLRSHQRHLHHRRPCAGRGRSGLSRRRSGTRHTFWRQRRNAHGGCACRSGAAADAELAGDALPEGPIG